MDTELDRCAGTAARPFGSNETYCGINEAAVNSNVVEQLAVHEQSLQNEPAHNLNAMTENSLESKQRSPSKIKIRLQPSLASPASTEQGTLSDVKSSRSYAPDQNKRNELTARKENSPQDLRAFGPELNVTTVKNSEHLADTSQNYSERQTEKLASVMVVESSKPVSKNDVSLKQSSLMVNSVRTGNSTTVSQNEMAAEHVTESKLQNLTMREQRLLRETSSTLDPDPAAEIKSKRSQAADIAEKHVRVRKKSKCEERSSFVDSVLAVLNSLAGKGKVGLFCCGHVTVS
jgi:hypothetical protein